MVRLVFRPYTQVRRTICTSVSLRASTRVSSGFTLLRHSSPSFGSRQMCSTQTFTEDQGRLAEYALHFHCARGLATRVLAHVSDSLVRVSRRVGCARSVSRRPTRAIQPSSPKPRPTVSDAHRARADPRRQSAPPRGTAESTARRRAQTGFLSPISSTL